ncbi:MAG TPA: alpha/beta fold hydrolase, partial [Terriglobales bacterium]|nr:alpha/beta fold hydrolase [Terriglobales bacterium]
MRKFLKLLAVLVCGYLLLAAVAGVVIAEASLKLRRRPIQHRDEAVALVRERYQAQLQEVNVMAADGVVLRGWYVHPKDSNGSAVLLLHGITDNREGMAGYAKLFLDAGYAVLLPDARDHGESGGAIATYGLKETDDVHRWVSWIYTYDPPRAGCVYGFGESYGAALILQSLAEETRYCAVAVESSFSTAREMSYERVSGPLHLGSWFGRTFGQPVIASAAVYGRLRYDIDLLQPNPMAALRHSTVPALLIHGMKDRNVEPRHSIALAQAAPGHVQLWLVPNAWHTGAWAASPHEFETVVLQWFGSHQQASRL